MKPRPDSPIAIGIRTGLSIINDPASSPILSTPTRLKNWLLFQSRLIPRSSPGLRPEYYKGSLWVSRWSFRIVWKMYCSYICILSFPRLWSPGMVLQPDNLKPYKVCRSVQEQVLAGRRWSWFFKKDCRHTSASTVQLLKTLQAGNFTMWSAIRPCYPGCPGRPPWSYNPGGWQLPAWQRRCIEPVWSDQEQPGPLPPGRLPRCRYSLSPA